MKTLDGKKALVLGGSRGIGKAIVERFRKEGASVTFTFAGSKKAALDLAESSSSSALKLDVSNRKELTSFIADQGAIDILVINAGIFLMGDPLELNPDGIDRMVDVNVKAPYHAAVEAYKNMSDGGRIIVIGSVNADRIPMAGASAYSMTKAAIQGMVQGLSRDFASKNVTVNNIQPGPTDTDMNPADGPFSEVMHSFMAQKRHGKPEEIASLVSYVAGPESGFITGANLSIDGGFSA